MAVLNIRNISDDLAAKVKSKAALARKSIREVTIGLLEEYVGDPPGSGDLNAAHCPVNGPVIKAGKGNKKAKK